MSTAGTDEELRRVAARSAEQIGAENFPVALRLLPRGPREALTRVYAFARFVDDVGDESRGDRLAMLNRVEADVRALWSGTAALPPVQGLAPHTDVLPQQALLDLIEANRIDQRVNRYDTFDELLGYCYLSAAPVGRIVLAIAGIEDAEAMRRSDDVCNALQVLEHCQDVAEDARAGRIYLPIEDLRGAGVNAPLIETLNANTASAPLRTTVALEVDRALQLLVSGRPLVRSLRGWARMAVAGYVAGGYATADAIAKAGFDTLASEVKPTKVRTLAHAFPIFLGR
jgi:squalene synthase HpnC